MTTDEARGLSCHLNLKKFLTFDIFGGGRHDYPPNAEEIPSGYFICTYSNEVIESTSQVHRVLYII